MDISTYIPKLVGTLSSRMPAETASATDSIIGQARGRRSPIRVASWLVFGVVGFSVAACQTQNGSAVSPASSEACLAHAREVVPAEASQRSSDLQRDRYFVYRACMHAAGLTH
ncbi:MAG: hypothetical protein WA813_14615 [Beijerinckiaceae bacterium]|jgi:hypothetical protein